MKKTIKKYFALVAMIAFAEEIEAAKKIVGEN
jgi:hypothetical protein